MLLRVRGAGASAANSEAVVMGIRGAKVNARGRPAASYAMQPPVPLRSSDEDDLDLLPRIAARTHTTLVSAIVNFHPLVATVDAAGDAPLPSLWAEVHNVLDIAFDEEDTNDELNPLGHLHLSQRRSAGAAEVPPRRTVAPLCHVVSAGPRVATPAAAEGAVVVWGVTAAELELELGLRPPLQMQQQAPLSSTDATIRQLVTAVSYVCVAAPSAARHRTYLVLTATGVQAKLASLLALAWGVAVGAVPDAEDSQSVGSLMDAAVGTAGRGGSLSVVTVDEYRQIQRAAATDSTAHHFALTAKAAQLVQQTVFSGDGRGNKDGAVQSMEAALSGVLEGLQAFDTSAADRMQEEEGRRENFCPCCGDHGDEGHDHHHH